jgi:hypothetical protein
MQNGSLIETKRRSGQSVWEFRWRDRSSGKAVYRRIVVALLSNSRPTLRRARSSKELFLRLILRIRVCGPVC